MLVADRQNWGGGWILKPCIPLQDTEGGERHREAGRACGGGGIFLVGRVGSGDGEKSRLLGRIGRDESCSGVSWVLAKIRSCLSWWNFFV